MRRKELWLFGRHIREIWQDGIMVVMIDAPTAEQADREAAHYATQYRQDGPIEIKKR